MNKEQILKEVLTSKILPEFEFTSDLDAVIDSALKTREDYFLGLHSKVKEIIKREIDFVLEPKPETFYSSFFTSEEDIRDVDKELSEHLKQKNYQITFEDVCKWQKELFEYKKYQIQEWIERANCIEQDEVKPYEVSNRDALIKKIKNLPNQHINLGLRQTDIKDDNWINVNYKRLEEFKELCFPIDTETFCDNICDSFNFVDPFAIKDRLTNFYRSCQSFHFFEDFNEHLGIIVINIISFILTRQYLIKKTK